MTDGTNKVAIVRPSSPVKQCTVARDGRVGFVDLFIRSLPPNFYLTVTAILSGLDLQIHALPDADVPADRTAKAARNICIDDVQIYFQNY